MNLISALITLGILSGLGLLFLFAYLFPTALLVCLLVLCALGLVFWLYCFVDMIRKNEFYDGDIRG